MAEKKNRFVLPVYGMDAKVVEEVELDPHVFNAEVHRGPIYQAIVSYRANSRMGLASTKTRGEVSGGGKKPWRQKGTGRARHGSIRSPLWRHGGITFGPHPRDFSYTVPQKIRNEALRSSLNAKINNGDLILIEKIHIMHPKTKEFVKFLEALKLRANRVLCVMDAIAENVKRSTRNIPDLCVVDAHSVSALDVVNHKKVLLTRDSLKNLTKRLKHV